MVTWKRERIRNFSEDWADAYITTLVRLDGEPYAQPRFFKELTTTGIVKDVPDQGSPTATDDLRFKRWDAYSNRIREYGLGFWERRSGGPKIWHSSPIARAYDAGRVSYREFMALQMMRTQVPVTAMPLAAFANEIAQDLRIRPLAITLRALRELGQLGAATYLSEEEFSQLQRVEADADLTKVLQDIIGSRSGPSSSDWVASIPSVDIWFNELRWTGYLRRVVANGSTLPGHVLVPRWARQDEASDLDAAIPIQTYSDLVGVNRFHDFFGSQPGDATLRVLRTAPDVVIVDVAADGSWDAGTGLLTGSFSVLGGLETGDDVVLQGTTLSPQDASALFRVIGGAERTGSGDVELPLEVAQRNMHGHPIQI
jgi:hypothetical protein